MPSGNLLGMDAKKIKQCRQDHAGLHQGRVAERQEDRRPGHRAEEGALSSRAQNSKKFADAPTEWITLIPTVYNADTLGIRPDLIKRPIERWTELLNPEFKGKASILNIPSIGIMDAAMVVEATGQHKYADKGNMTKAEIDLTMKILIEAKKAGQFRAFWKDFNESVNLMASGETVIQSMWSPAVTDGALEGHRLHVPAAQGRLSRLGVGLRRAEDAHGQEARLRPMSSSTGSCPAGPAPTSTARATTRPCSPPPRPTWSPTSGPTGWKASRPTKDIKAPDGTLLEKAGAVRDGGSYEERMGGVACWNAVMDENDYMVRKWNEFIAA